MVATTRQDTIIAKGIYHNHHNYCVCMLISWFAQNILVSLQSEMRSILTHNLPFPSIVPINM